MQLTQLLKYKRGMLKLCSVEKVIKYHLGLDTVAVHPAFPSIT